MNPTTDDLVERVAAAIAKADGWDPIDEVSEHWREYRGVARAAIRVVVEHMEAQSLRASLAGGRGEESCALLIASDLLRQRLPKDTP